MPESLHLTPPDPRDLSTLPPAPEKKITVAEAEAAAQDAGLSLIRVKKLAASAKVGKYIEQLGAQRIGRTTLVIAQESIEDGIKQCDQLIAKAETEDGVLDLMIEIMKIRQAFTDQLIKTGTAQMKNEERFLTGPPPPKSLHVPFPPGSKIAIQSADDPPNKS